MRKDLLLFFVTAFFVTISCGQAIETDETGAWVSVDETSIEVEANHDFRQDPFAEGAVEVTDTIMVSSSRSLIIMVRTDDGGDWVRSSVKERVNVSGNVETFPIVLDFDKYKGEQERTASLLIYAADLDEPLVVPIVQKPFIPFIEVSLPGNPTVVSSVDGQTYAIVRSNTWWTIAVDENSSTVVPDLSMFEGVGTRAVFLDFPTNTDDMTALVATLMIKAEGCADCLVEVIQTQSERYFMLAGEVAQVLQPYESNLHIPLRSNGEWTAELSDCTFEGAALTPSGGYQSLNGFTFSSAHGSDPTISEKRATITIRRDGYDDIVLQIRQKGSIHLSVNEYNPEYEFDGTAYNDLSHPYRPYMAKPYPFLSPSTMPGSYNSYALSGQVTDCIFSEEGYAFTAYGSDCGIWLDAGAYGLCVGKAKNDYLLLPAIEGYRLSEMYYEASALASNPYAIRTEDGSRIIKGGELSWTRRSVPIDSNYNDIRVHVFPDTQPGTRYRLNLEEDYRMISIKDLCLVYEKVN